MDSGQGGKARHSAVGQVPLLPQGAGDGATHPLGPPALGIGVPDMDACIATKTHRDCKQEGTWDCYPPQTDNTVKSATAIHAYFGQIINLHSLIFRRWKNFIVWQNIFSSGSMCRCILLDKIVHDKHNNKLHWTRVEQTIMHNYAQLCTIMQFGPIVNYAKLCTIMHVHNPPPLPPAKPTGRERPVAGGLKVQGQLGVSDLA